MSFVAEGFLHEVLKLHQVHYYLPLPKAANGDKKSFKQTYDAVTKKGLNELYSQALP